MIDSRAVSTLGVQPCARLLSGSSRTSFSADTHESRGIDMIGRSRIVNPGPAATGHFAVVETAPELVVHLDDAFR